MTTLSNSEQNISVIVYIQSDVRLQQYRKDPPSGGEWCPKLDQPHSRKLSCTERQIHSSQMNGHGYTPGFADLLQGLQPRGIGNVSNVPLVDRKVVAGSPPSS